MKIILIIQLIFITTQFTFSQIAVGEWRDHLPYSKAIDLVDGDNKIYNSITNVGSSPTFNENQRRVETHILDFNKNIYFKKVKIHFLYKLRDEIRFNSMEELVEQINTDKAHATNYFENLDIDLLNLG